MFDETSIRLLIVVAVLAGVLALGLGIIGRYRRSLHEEDSTDGSLLDQLRSAVEAGEMDEDEYRRVIEALARPRTSGAKDRP